ncbi:hypothetical protein [Bosea sp. UC22_33]|uniref:hypothetical protein n=1 Tax=Bosea sp. UC22_33 TaxID=3350165 RepID=UPI00366B3CC9
MSGELFGLVGLPAILFAGGYLLVYPGGGTAAIILGKLAAVFIVGGFLFVAYMSMNMPNVHDDPKIFMTYAIFIVAGVLSCFKWRIGLLTLLIPYALMLYFYLHS